METKRLYRTSKNRIFAGVCGGIGEYFNVDPVIVRLAWVAGTLFSFGAGFLGYLIAYAVIPGKNESGQETRRSGCLIAILIILVISIVIPAILSLLGFVGVGLFSGIGMILNIFPGMITPGNSLVAVNWSLILFFFAIPVIIILILVLLIIRSRR